MDWKKIRLVSLDIDGTVYSLPRMKWNFTCLLLKRFPMNPYKVLSDVRQIRHFHTKMAWLRENQNPFQSKDFSYLQKIETEIKSDWYGKAIAKSGMFPGLLPFLEELKKKNIKIVACSDFQCSFKLKALGLESYFEKYYEGSLSGQLKPLSSIIETIKRDYSLGADEVLHVGDHPERDGDWGRMNLCHTHIVRHSFQELLVDSFFNGP